MSTPAPQATVPAQLNPLSTTTASGHPVPPHPPTVAITAPTIPPVPSYSPATSIGRVRPDRIASGPSSLPRPKTPERRAQTAVFKAKTPEKRMTPARTPEAPPSSSAIGKKRRAPDDFEACESVPAQGFTADSLPRDDMEHTTPRLRRDFQSGQGFTPLRHHAARPTIPIPSPKRVLSNAGRPPIYIADVTNSPRLASAPIPSTKEVKRSWLGRIRGAPSQLQVNGRTSSRVFERLPGGVA
jgi:myosin protein heavy chain